MNIYLNWIWTLKKKLKSNSNSFYNIMKYKCIPLTSKYYNLINYLSKIYFKIFYVIFIFISALKLFDSKQSLPYFLLIIWKLYIFWSLFLDILDTAGSDVNVLCLLLFLLQKEISCRQHPLHEHYTKRATTEGAIKWLERRWVITNI